MSHGASCSPPLCGACCSRPACSAAGPAPAWLLSLHRFLGGLAVVFVGVHVGVILLDSYTNFGPLEVLVLMTSSWHPVAVAWGIVAMYLLVAIEVTSLLRRRMSRRAWRAVHLTSYWAFGLTVVHMVSAGTDVKSYVTSGLAVAIGTIAVFGSAALYAWRRDVTTATVSAADCASSRAIAARIDAQLVGGRGQPG